MYAKHLETLHFRPNAAFDRAVETVTRFVCSWDLELIGLWVCLAYSTAKKGDFFMTNVKIPPIKFFFADFSVIGHMLKKRYIRKNHQKFFPTIRPKKFILFSKSFFQRLFSLIKYSNGCDMRESMFIINVFEYMCIARPLVFEWRGRKSIWWFFWARYFGDS